MIVMIDNKDSFTYNIVDYVEYERQQPVTVIDVEAVSIEKLKEMQPTALIISPDLVHQKIILSYLKS